MVGAAALGAAAVLGGGVALGGAAAFGDLGGKTTTVREVAAQAAPAASQVPPKALSINDIYQRSARGVVQVTSTSVVTVPADPFFGNLFPEPAAAAVARLRLRDRQGGPHRHELPRRPGRQADQRQLLERRQHEGDGRRHRSVERPRRAQGRRELARADAAAARRLRRRCGSATRSSRSATRSASTARSRPASSARSSARSPRRTATRSTTSSRPTRRSTTATPAGRS